MFTRISFTAFLALPLLSNAGVIPVLPPVLPSVDSTGLAGRQVITVSPTICPVLPRDESDDGTDIEGRQVITLSPTLCPLLPRDESDDSSDIAARQVVTVSPVVGSLLPALPRDESDDDTAVISGRQVVTVSPVVGTVPALPRDEADGIAGRQVTTVSPVIAPVLPVLPIGSTITSVRRDITGSAVISPFLPRGGGDGAACGTSGTAQCCDSTQSASDLSPSVATLLGLLGVVVSDLTANVGVTCSPISVIGVGGTSCSSQTVCCDDNHFNGAVSLGCTPLDVGL